MNAGDYEYFRKLLTDKKNNYIDRFTGFESGMQGLQTFDSELEEEAQKESIKEVYEKLALRDRERIFQIDRALTRIDEGRYGKCPGCGKSIPRGRLEVLPEAEFCLKCQEMSKDPVLENIEIEEDNLICSPDNYYHDLDDDEMAQLIRETLLGDDRVDIHELKISCHKDRIHLRGILSSEEEHQIVIRTILDSFCSGQIVDRIEIGEVEPGEEREGNPYLVMNKNPDIQPNLGEEDLTADPFELEEEDAVYDAPYRPPSQEYA